MIEELTAPVPPLSPQEELACGASVGDFVRGGWVLRNPRGRLALSKVELWRGWLRVCWRRVLEEVFDVWKVYAA